MATTKDIQAMLDWCALYRPDWGAVIEAMAGQPNSEGFFDTLRLGFEAGRLFQHNNPTAPLYPNHDYSGDPNASSSASPPP